MKLLSGESQSYLRKVETSVGVFTVHFPYGVFNKEDKMNDIPEAIKDFFNKTSGSDINQLQKTLNTAICFGTSNPQGIIDIRWTEKEKCVFVS